MSHSNKSPQHPEARLLTVCLALLIPSIGMAIDVFQVSPDTTINMGAQTVADQSVALDGVAVSLASLGALPAPADLSAYHVLANGDRLFVLDIATSLPGGVYAESRDVVRYNGSTYSLEFDGSAAGIPAGTSIDALSMDQTNALLMSFDIAVNAGGIPAADEDLLRFSANAFSLFFDGSAAGIASGLDLDAAHYLPAGNQLLLSFDTSGQVGSTYFDDDDVLLYTPANTQWSAAYRGASKHAGFDPADLDALYIALYTSEIFKDGFEVLP